MSIVKIIGGIVTLAIIAAMALLTFGNVADSNVDSGMIANTTEAGIGAVTGFTNVLPAIVVIGIGVVIIGLVFFIANGGKGSI